MENKLNEKEEKVYSSIKCFIRENCYSPSVRELCELNNIPSTATIYDIMKTLKNKGYIDYVKNKSRTIRILKGE